MHDPAYAAFSALDPFFDIVRRGLAGLVDGDQYFDTIAPDAVFEFRYRFPGYPTKVVGREALMALYAGYGKGMALHGAGALVVALVQIYRCQHNTQREQFYYAASTAFQTAGVLLSLRRNRAWLNWPL
jgi:hypothetical protein